jgi:large subunit ribosomal protein L32
MGLPGHRRTSSDKRRRAAHFALEKKSLAVCSKCHAPLLPHTVCKECGSYAGRQVTKLDNPVEAKKKAASKKKEDQAG